MYVGGYLLAVKTAQKEAYRKMAEDVAVVFRDHGATRIVECWGDDVPEGKLTSFPMAVKREADETVVFSWMEYPDRETYKTGLEAAMKDPRMKMPEGAQLFDGKRMMWGGFDVIVDA